MPSSFLIEQYEKQERDIHGQVCWTLILSLEKLTMLKQSLKHLLSLSCSFNQRAGENDSLRRRSLERRSNNTITDLILLSRRVGSNSYTREVNHNKIAPASPEQYLPIATESIQVLRTSKDVNADLPITDRTLRNEKQMDIEVNGIHENVLQVEKKSSWRRKHRLCCFSPSRP